MADLNFPLNPQINDYYTLNGKTFRFDGTKWRFTSQSIVTVTSGTALTSLNGLTNSAQNFSVGITGNTFNISSSGNTHNFNIPYAGSGSTGLITYQAQTIAGAKTFSSAIIGDLTGTATTSTNLSVIASSTNANHYILFSPINGGSGVAVSSDAGLLFNPASNTLTTNTFSAGVSVATVAASISGSTASTSPSAGALVVTGGAGVGQSVSIGGRLQLFNGSNYTAFVSSASGNTVYTLPATTPATGSSVLQSDSGGTLSWVPMTATGSGSGTTSANVNVNSASTNSSHFLIFSPTATGSGVALSSESALVYNPSTDILSVSGAAITNTTASTTSSSGALIVTGGVGIGQSVSVGGRLQMFNGANYTAFVSSASGNTVYTLPATSPATGSSVLQSTSAGVMSWVPMTASGGGSGTTSANVNIVAAGNANVFHSVLFTPSPSSSGSAISSDSTISFNPSTEILNVSGLAITSGTASTNTTTGALVVRGGLGVTGQLSFSQASFGFTGITTNPSMSFIGATTSSPITLTVLTDNSLNFEGSQGSVFSIDSNLSSGEIFSVSDISGLPIISASAGQTVNINEFGGFTQIGNGSINSSSTTTGSLVVSGGLGVTGNANIGGTVRITNTTASTTSSSGALTVSGGVGIGLSASIGGRLQLFNGANYTAFVSSATGNTVYTLPATSPATGTSVLVSSSAGVLSWVAPTSVGNTSTGTTDGTVQYKSGSGFAGTNSFFYDTTLYALRLSNFPAGEATSSTSAALKVEQTTGSFNGSLNGTMIAVNANNGFTGDLLNLQTNANTKFRVDANGAIGTSSDIVSLSTTASTNTTSGALQVRGGASIAQTLFVGGNILNTNYFYSGGNNYTKSGQAQGDIFLDNNSNDTPGLLYYYKNNTNFGIDAYAVGIGATRLRIVKDLNESGGAELWSIDRTGVVTQTAWGVGETIKTQTYNYSDLGMSSGGDPTSVNSTSYTTIATGSYTPSSSSSYLWIEFSATYDYNAGTNADEFAANIEVGGTEIVNVFQKFIGATGGGTRSGVLFPLSGRYTNSGTSTLSITVRVKRNSGDDPIRVFGNAGSGLMRIQEIGR